MEILWHHFLFDENKPLTPKIYGYLVAIYLLLRKYETLNLRKFKLPQIRVRGRISIFSSMRE